MRKNLIFRHFAILALIVFTICACEKPDDGKIESFLKCDTQSVELLSVSGTFEIRFSTNLDWTAKVDQSWCKLSNTSGQGQTNLTIPLTITVEENKSLDSRSCQVTISTKDFSQTITVTQLPTGAIIIKEKEYNIDHTAQVVNVELQTNIDLQIAIEKSCQQWIKVSKAKGLTNQTVSFEISENEGDEDRTGHIHFYQVETGDATETITITQSASNIIQNGTLYSILDSKTFDNLDSYSNQMNVEGGLKSNLAMAMMLFKMKAPNYKEPARMFNIEYDSSDMDGNPCKMSAAVLVPEKAITDSREIKGIVLSNPSFTIRNEDCPTSIPDMFGIISWMNYIVVMPDTFGFGSSNGHFPAYLNKDVCAHCDIDAFTAVLQFIQNNKLNVKDNYINMGYSLGAYTSLATEKYIAENPDCGVSFDKTIIGSGCYDILATFEDFPKIGSIEATPLIVISSISLNETDHLGIDYSDIFKGSVLEHYKEWLISRTYTREELNGLFGSSTIYDVMTEDFMAQRGESYNKIKSDAQRNSLVSGWTPAAGSNYFIYHSKADEYVSYRSFEELKENFDSKPGNYTVTYSTSETSGHMAGALDYALNLVIPQL